MCNPNCIQTFIVLTDKKKLDCGWIIGLISHVNLDYLFSQLKSKSNVTGVGSHANFEYCIINLNRELQDKINKELFKNSDLAKKSLKE